MTTPRILSLTHIEERTSSASFDASLIDAIEQGFASFSAGKFNTCPIQTMGAPPMAPMKCDNPTTDSGYAAQVCVKSGYLTGDAYFVIKVAAGGAPWNNSGLMHVYSQATGQLEALLLDQGVLTELRTAAAGAVATRMLGPKVVTKIGVLGTGIQARYQLRFLQSVTDCKSVLISGRTPENVQMLQADLEKQGWAVEIAASPNDLIQQCNLIITATCAREALITQPPDHPTLIVCIGADSLGKQELDTALVANADCLVCDSRLQTRERGEFQHVIKSGEIDVDSTLELGEVVSSPSVLATDRMLTIFDSSGVAFQDCVVAKMVYDAFLTSHIE